MSPAHQTNLDHWQSSKNAVTDEIYTDMLFFSRMYD